MISGLRIAAAIEGFTLLAMVLIAMPLKYMADLPIATKVMGPVHGFAFLFFMWWIVRAFFEEVISGKAARRLVVGAFIPFGGLINERWLRRECAKGHPYVI